MNARINAALTIMTTMLVVVVMLALRATAAPSEYASKKPSLTDLIRPTTPPQTANATCTDCHGDIADEWRASLHRDSDTDPSYQRSFRREPRAFCRTCHQPEGKSEELAAMGTACITCHGTDHATPKQGDAACAGCHEFSFPDRGGSTKALDRMQLTLLEHAQSANATTACVDCHMPKVGEGASAHRSHVFAASRDPDMLRSAVKVSARIVTADGESFAELTLSPGATGHAFPTGDLFRRLAITVEQVDSMGLTMNFERQTLGRTFEVRATHQTQIADTRPGAPGRPQVTLRFPIRDASLGRIRYSLDYQRVLTANRTLVEVERSTRVLESWIQ